MSKNPISKPHTHTHTTWFLCYLHSPSIRLLLFFESQRHCWQDGHNVCRGLSSRNSPRQFFLQETWLPWSFPSLTLSWKGTHQGIKLSPLNRSAVLSLTRNVSSLTLLSGSGAKPDVTHWEGPSASLGRVIEKGKCIKLHLFTACKVSLLIYGSSFSADTPGIITVPKTPFFSRLNEDPQTKSVSQSLVHRHFSGPNLRIYVDKMAQNPNFFQKRTDSVLEFISAV